MEDSIIKATKEGRLYIEIKDLLKSAKVRETISKLMDSDIIREIDKKEKFVLQTGKNYVSKDQEYFVFNRSGNHGNIGLRGEELSEHISCYIEEDWREATEEESKKYIEKLLNLKYGEGWEKMEIKECMRYRKDPVINSRNFDISLVNMGDSWRIWNENGSLFNERGWAEALETKKVAVDLSEIDRPYFIDSYGETGIIDRHLIQSNNHMTSEELCEGILALQQLIAFRDNFHEVRGSVDETKMRSAILFKDEVKFINTNTNNDMFQFISEEQAKEFYKTHEDLFKELKKLY